MVSTMDAIVDSGEAKYDTAGSLWDGKRVFMSMELPKHIKVRGDDSEYLSYLLGINGHDGDQAVEFIRTTVRAVCHNTVEAAKASALARFTARHTPGVTARVGEIRDALQVTFRELETLEQVLNSMTRVKVNEAKARDVLLKVFPLSEADKGTAEAELAKSDFAAALANWKSTETLDDKLRGTAYGLYQAVVEYADFGLNYRKADNRASDLMTNNGRPGRVKKAALALLKP
jgi:phage/plasmid-like protein (TIGR03299 family)